MRAADDRLTYSSRGTLRTRATSAALAVLVAALVVLLLILSGAIPQITVPVGRALSTFNVLPGGETKSPSLRPKAQAQTRAAAKRSPPPPPSRTIPPPIVPMPVTPPSGMIVLSKEDYAAGDIGRIKGTASAGASGAESASADSASTYGPGAGPGGKRLYAAEWYREPTHQELAFYMPPGATEGWATIACRTIDRYHVDNCQVLGETPGSGIGRGLRQAAWQFLVIPPRVNGRAQVGTWVRIRFDLVKGLQK